MKHLTAIALIWLSPFTAFSQEIIWQRTTGPADDAFNILVLDSLKTTLVGSKEPQILYSRGEGGTTLGQKPDTTPGAFLAAAADTGSRLYGIFRNRLLKNTWELHSSGDRGRTWQFLRRIDSGDIVSVVDRRTVVTSGASGLAISTDGGLTATSIAVDKSMPGSAMNRSLAFQPVSPGEFYVATIAGIFRTADKGITWESRNNGISELATNLALAPDNTIYAGGATSIFRSTNSGQDWSKLPISSTDSDFRLSVGPDGTIYAADGSLRLSRDRGMTWIRSGIDSTVVLSVLAIDEKTVIAGTTPLGLQVSEDGGFSWRRVTEEFTGSDIAGTTLSQGRLIASTRAGRFGSIFISDDKGQSWHRKRLDPRPSATTSLSSFDGNVAVGTDEHGVYFSSDNGENWKQLNDGLSDTQVLATHIPSPGRVLASTASGIFVLPDPSGRWSLRSGEAKSMHAFVSSGPTILAGGIGGQVYISGNNGEDWQQSGRLPVNAPILAMMMDRGGILYAATDGRGIYYSDDLGTTWKSTSATTGTYRTIAEGLRDVLYAGGPDGLVESTDGIDWFTAPTWLDHPVTSLTFDRSENRAYAGTLGNGVATGEIRTTGVPTMPIAVILTPRVSVTPSSTHATIECASSSSGRFTLRIVNVQGQVCHWSSETLPSGQTFQKHVQIAGWPSGMYMVELRTAETTAVSRFFLCR